MKLIRSIALVGIVCLTAVRTFAQDVTPSDEKSVPVQPDAPPAEQSSASVDPHAKQLLEQAAKALADAKTLTFRSKTWYTGFLNGISYTTDATVRMVRPADNPTKWRMRTIGGGSKKADQPRQPFDVLWEPGSVLWLDESAKKLVERPGGQSKGIPVQMAASSYFTFFRDAAPLSKEIAGDSLTHEGSEDVGGIPCEMVVVRLNGRKGHTKFWLGAADHLPRKVERVSESTSYSSSTFIEVSDLKVDDEIAPELISIAVPEGYTKDSTVTAKPAAAAQPEAAKPPESSTEGAPVVATDGGAPAVAPPNPPQAPAAETRTLAPEFELKGADGATVSLASLKGKPVLLFFWGTWSLASREADIPVQVLHEKFSPNGLKVLALSAKEKHKDSPAKLMSERSHTFTLLTGADEVAKQYEVTIFPTFVLVDADGYVAARIENWRKDETGLKLADEIGKLLPEAAPDAKINADGADKPATAEPRSETPTTPAETPK